MKTTTLIPPALLITGLLLSGCSGLDNPSNVVGQPRDFYGTYTFNATTDGKQCSNAKGNLIIDEDGKVTGSKVVDSDTGEPINITGSMDSDGNGGISGSFVYPSQDVAIPTEFNGEHTTFIAIPAANQAAECDFLTGRISLTYGNVEGTATDQNTNTSIRLTGSLKANGEIEGQFIDESTTPNTYRGEYSGIITTSATGTGSYLFGSCVGQWTAEKNSGTYSGTILAGADGSGDSGDGTWNDETFDCPLGAWSAENITVTP